MDNLKSLDTLEKLLAAARAAGADAAAAVLIESTHIHAASRSLCPEAIERSESRGLGLRAWAGKRQATVSSTDLAIESFTELAERGVAMARSAPEDADATLPPDNQLARNLPSLDLYDAEEPSSEWLMVQARMAEEFARAVKGVTSAENAAAEYGSAVLSLASSRGFAQSYRSSMFSLSVSAVAGTGTEMERDYDYASVRHRRNMPAPEAIGKSAGLRAVKRLNPRKISTRRVPVIFEPRTAKSLLGYFAGAVNGASVARGTSFLKDRMGKQIFAKGVSVVDDPLLPRGLSSRPFDGEGVACRKLSLVKDGELCAWLLDVRSANKLKLETTGNAVRGTASAPSPSASNLFMQKGTLTPEALIAETGEGFYVTETFGMGVNLITGDFSQGAAGFWIEGGKIAYPVSGLTIAGHLSDMFAALTPADDLEFRYSVNAPTLRIDGMTVAGT